MHKAHQVSEPPAHGVHCIAEHTARGRVNCSSQIRQPSVYDRAMSRPCASGSLLSASVGLMLVTVPDMMFRLVALRYRKRTKISTRRKQIKSLLLLRNILVGAKTAGRPWLGLSDLVLGSRASRDIQVHLPQRRRSLKALNLCCAHGRDC